MSGNRFDEILIEVLCLHVADSSMQMTNSQRCTRWSMRWIKRTVQIEFCYWTDDKHWWTHGALSRQTRGQAIPAWKTYQVWVAAKHTSEICGRLWHIKVEVQLLVRMRALWDSGALFFCLFRYKSCEPRWQRLNEAGDIGIRKEVRFDDTSRWPAIGKQRRCSQRVRRHINFLLWKMPGLSPSTILQTNP